MQKFRVIDCRTKLVVPEEMVEADSPEQAAGQALGLKLTRSGPPRALAARVYWTSGGDTNMVRLYTPAGSL